MQFKNNISVIIPIEKLTNYLLNETHPVGKSKAKFFIKHGYTLNNIDELKKQLTYLIENNDIKETIETEYGSKYIIDGHIKSTIETKIRIRTIWIIENSMNEIRFITCYPI